MTIASDLGFEVGGWYEVVYCGDGMLATRVNVGDYVKFTGDDGSSYPYFETKTGISVCASVRTGNSGVIRVVPNKKCKTKNDLIEYLESAKKLVEDISKQIKDLDKEDSFDMLDYKEEDNPFLLKPHGIIYNIHCVSDSFLKESCNQGNVHKDKSILNRLAKWRDKNGKFLLKALELNNGYEYDDSTVNWCVVYHLGCYEVSRSYYPKNPTQVYFSNFVDAQKLADWANKHMNNI